MTRAGVSLMELVAAAAIAGLGMAAVASLTATAARTLARAGALDEAHAVLRSFVDSARAGDGPASGRRDLPSGALTWSVPQAPGSDAWAQFDHVALPDSIVVRFNVVATEVVP